jgi:hypothetical protein
MKWIMMLTLVSVLLAGCVAEIAPPPYGVEVTPPLVFVEPPPVIVPCCWWWGGGHWHEGGGGHWHRR